jgi:hypothetical protein
MGNKFSLGKKNKINVQQAIEQINKNESINYDDDDYLDDEKRLEEMISARYRDREEQDTIRERERENENAFNEIHVSFFKINIEKYLDFIDSYIKKPNSYYENLNLEEFIESKFFTFIDSNFDEELKDSSKYKLEKILQKLFESECYELQINKWRILIGKTLDYVFKQDDKFISAYIITFINDTFFVYKDKSSSISCAQGIIERFITIISPVLEILCITDADCTDEKSIELYKILNNTIDINDFTKKWATEYLDTQSIQSMSKEERKQHFIEFIKYEYTLKKKQDLSKPEINSIIKYANDLETAGVFEKGYFGGKKRICKTRKHKNLKKSKKSKKSKKIKI